MGPIESPEYLLVIFYMAAISRTIECIGLSLYCGAGQFLNKTQGMNIFCQECPNNTYNEDDNHTFENCKKCQHYTLNVDRVEKVEPCTKRSRTKILQCANGLRLEDNYPHNYRCVPCDFKTPGCFSSVIAVDTTADPMHSSLVQPDSAGTLTNATSKRVDSCVEAIKRLDGCSIDEFVNIYCTQIGNRNISTNLGFFCLPCPIGTHMNKTNHSETSCVSNTFSYNNTKGKNALTSATENNHQNLIVVLTIAGGALICAIGFILVWCKYYKEKKPVNYSPVLLKE